MHTSIIDGKHLISKGTQKYEEIRWRFFVPRILQALGSKLMANRDNAGKNGIPNSYGRLMRTLKRIYYRFLRIRGTPNQISLGLALGIFIGMTPFLGFHTVIAVLLASVLKWSKITAALGVLITNPFTAPFIYPFTYHIGAKVTGFSDRSQWLKIFEPGGVIGLMEDSPMILVDLSVGGGIIGLPLAVISYYVAINAVSRARRRLELRKARRMAKKAALRKKYNQAVKNPRETTDRQT